MAAVGSEVWYFKTILTAVNVARFEQVIDIKTAYSVLYSYGGG